MSERFLPSRHGFTFANSWPSQAAFTQPTPFGTITLGDASAGLCGGMVFAAVDYWRAGVAPPSDRPSAGTRVYRFIVDRLLDSWHIPAGIAQYFQWMNLPDGDATFTMLRRKIVIERGVAWRTIKGTTSRCAAFSAPRMRRATFRSDVRVARQIQGIGSTGRPPRRTSKCRCGPVAAPVEPTRPIT
jgi:hypothetical protein